MCVCVCVCVCVCMSICVCMDVFHRYTFLTYIVYVPNSSTAGEGTTISRPPLNTDSKWHTLNASQDAFRENGTAI